MMTQPAALMKVMRLQLGTAICYDWLVVVLSEPDMLAPRLFLAPILLAALAIGGCRAIPRFGESKQSIAARRLSRQGHKHLVEGD
ncbi:MAG: hypothetical protein AAGA03_11135, partial [Planctomycetota bacterium]